MSSDAINIIITLAGFLFAMGSILFGWLFYRTSVNSAELKAASLQNAENLERLRLEYVEKIKDIYEENKADRQQHNRDMLEMHKEMHAAVISIGDKLAVQIKDLNIMPESNVKEWTAQQLTIQLEPIVGKLEKSISEAMKDAISIVKGRNNAAST